MRTKWVKAPYKNEVFNYFIDAYIYYFRHKCISINIKVLILF